MNQGAHGLLKAVIEVSIGQVVSDKVAASTRARVQRDIWQDVFKTLVSPPKGSWSKTEVPTPNFEEAISARWIDPRYISPFVVAAMDVTAEIIRLDPTSLYSARLVEDRLSLFGVRLASIDFAGGREEVAEERAFAFAQLAARGCSAIMRSPALRKSAYARAREVAFSPD